MPGLKYGLLSTTALVLAIGAGTAFTSEAAGVDDSARPIRIAANPCAANPCSPCAARAAGAATSCVVPRLIAADRAKNPCAAKNPCNPCAAKNPCNPCAAKNPCNPCAAKNPCNPCAAKNPCNPCAAKNPCNPCAAGGGDATEATPPKLSEAETIAAYDCVDRYMAAAYRASGHAVAAAYRGWTRFSRTPYPAEAHGVRFMNNYANDAARDAYGKWEGVGAMPIDSVLAKDSFVVAEDGKISVGPLFVMEKHAAGFDKASRDWLYEMIMPDGTVRNDASIQKFCNNCHRRAGARDDYLMFLPLPYRVSSTATK